MMETTKEEVLKIKLKGDDIKNFKSAIEKINEADSKIGFKGLLSDDEKKVVSSLKDKL